MILAPLAAAVSALLETPAATSDPNSRKRNPLLHAWAGHHTVFGVACNLLVCDEPPVIWADSRIAHLCTFESVYRDPLTHVVAFPECSVTPLFLSGTPLASLLREPRKESGEQHARLTDTPMRAVTLYYIQTIKVI